jgi:hypothetical protein
MSQQVGAFVLRGLGQIKQFILRGLGVGTVTIPTPKPVAFVLDFDHQANFILDFDHAKTFTLDFAVMSTTQNVTLPGKFNVATIRTLKPTLKLDNTTWNLSDPSTVVTATFLHRESGTTFQRAMTVVDAANGVVQYTSTVTDFLESGWWNMAVRVQQTGIDETYQYDISFYMAAQAGQG